MSTQPRQLKAPAASSSLCCRKTQSWDLHVWCLRYGPSCHTCAPLGTFEASVFSAYFAAFTAIWIFLESSLLRKANLGGQRTRRTERGSRLSEKPITSARHDASRTRKTQQHGQVFLDQTERLLVAHLLFRSASSDSCACVISVSSAFHCFNVGSYSSTAIT